MPVNMDPKKRIRKGSDEPSERAMPHSEESNQNFEQPREFGELTEKDKELELADAERKNLWDAMEVIDMDTW